MRLFFMIFMIKIFIGNNCNMQLSDAGINDYNLGLSYKDLCNEILPLQLNRNSNSLVNSKIEVFSYFEKNNQLNEESKVLYHFAFKDSVLCGYTFEMEISDIQSYKEFIRRIEKDNAFITSYKTSYLEKKDGCERFIRLRSKGKQLLISGGIDNIGGSW
ncbi:hypothetical protein FK220_006505 [Flavobacteriaceae bacterium TP-CH-4]|uniref:Uncharacterized protein n=1 Tax=Pelagihabitans pacificus TaxID=2696054 RepID=A0A967E519_9FLAO|nr:hypothetical protein [Pelagihabitans pacificus]NHF58982.1 hypothetical protein [Pelagihabitans pacificus]